MTAKLKRLFSRVYNLILNILGTIGLIFIIFLAPFSLVFVLVQYIVFLIRSGILNFRSNIRTQIQQFLFFSIANLLYFLRIPCVYADDSKSTSSSSEKQKLEDEIKDLSEKIKQETQELKILEENLDTHSTSIAFKISQHEKVTKRAVNKISRERDMNLDIEKTHYLMDKKIQNLERFEKALYKKEEELTASVAQKKEQILIDKNILKQKQETMTEIKKIETYETEKAHSEEQFQKFHDTVVQTAQDSIKNPEPTVFDGWGGYGRTPIQAVWEFLCWYFGK